MRGPKERGKPIWFQEVAYTPNSVISTSRTSTTTCLPATHLGLHMT